MSSAIRTNASDHRDESSQCDQTRSLLRSYSSSSSLAADDSGDSQLIQKAISLTFKSSAALANLLPTGTVLAFQLLSPIVTNQGDCDDACRAMTGCLVALCALSCFVSCFTDSFKAADGRVYHGIATVNGLWVLDADTSEASVLDPERARAFRIRFLDFVHAFASVLVFAAVALFDRNVVNCFYPVLTKAGQEVLSALPVGFGIVCSMVFMVFPTTRHGVGYSVTP